MPDESCPIAVIIYNTQLPVLQALRIKNRTDHLQQENTDHRQ